MPNNLSIFQIFDKVIKYIGNQLEKVKGNVNVSKDVTLWVAPDGSDTTGNGTEAKPFVSIQKAVDSLGDVIFNCTIRLKEGEYTITSSGGTVKTLVTIIKKGVLNIVGDSRETTILNINDENYTSTYVFSSQGATVYISNLSIKYKVSSPTTSSYKEILIFYTYYDRSSMINAFDVNIDLDVRTSIQTYIFYCVIGEIITRNIKVTANSSNAITGVYCANATVNIFSLIIPEDTNTVYRGFLIRAGGRIIKSSTVDWRAKYKEIENQGGFVETY